MENPTAINLRNKTFTSNPQKPSPPRITDGAERELQEHKQPLLVLLGEGILGREGRIRNGGGMAKTGELATLGTSFPTPSRSSKALSFCLDANGGWTASLSLGRGGAVNRRKRPKRQ